jgi:hypothetical protein
MSLENIYLVEITSTDGTTLTVNRYCTGVGYMSLPGDTPPNTFYDPRVLQPGLFSQSMFAPGTTGGSSSGGYGEIVLDNVDGKLDTLIDAGFDGQPCLVKRGHPGQPLSTFAVVLTGTVEQITPSWNDVKFRMKDLSADLNVPFQPHLYGGSNVLPDGIDGGPELLGKQKPRLSGQCDNVSPVFINTSKLTYQINDGPVYSIPKVYDMGVELTPGNNYATHALLHAATPAVASFDTCLVEGLFRLGSNPAGQVTCDVLEGATAADRTVGQIIKRLSTEQLRILSTEMNGPPVGIYGATTWTEPTPGVYQGTNDGTAPYHCLMYIYPSQTPNRKYRFQGIAYSDGTIVPRMDCATNGVLWIGVVAPPTCPQYFDFEVVLLANEWLSAGFINTDPATGHWTKFQISIKEVLGSRVSVQPIIDLDKAAPYPVGIYTDGSTTYQSIFDQLCQSVGAWYGFDNLGIFWCSQLQAPLASQSILTLGADECSSMERVAVADGDKGVPLWRVIFNYAKNWTKQTGLAGSVTQARMAELALEGKSTSASDQSIKKKHALAGEMTINSLIAVKADGDSEAGRSLALRSVRRDRMKGKVPSSALQYPAGGFWDDEAITETQIGVFGAASVVYNGYMYMIGGYNTAGNGVIANVQRLNLNDPTGLWDDSPTDYPTSIQDTIAVMNGSKLYIIGGRNGPGTGPTRNVRYLDLANPSGAWVNDTDFPTPILGGIGFSYGGIIYVLGGYTGAYSKKTYRFNFGWQDAQISDYPTNLIYGAAGVYNGYIYCMAQDVLSGSNTRLCRISLGALTGGWDSTSMDYPLIRLDIPTPLFVGNYLYSFGGYIAGYGPLPYITQCSRLNLDTPFAAWENEAVTDLPEPRAFAMAGVYNGAIYLVGGNTLTDGGTPIKFPTTYRLRNNSNPDDIAHLSSIGRTLTLKFPRYGYTGGRPMKIIGEESNLADGEVTLDLWG